MLEEKIRISNIKKLLFAAAFFAVIFTNIASGLNIVFILFSAIMLAVVVGFGKSFLKGFSTLDLTLKNLSKCYLEIIFIIVVEFFSYYFIYLRKANPLYLIPVVLLSISLLFCRLLEVSYKANSVKDKFFAAVNSIDDINADITFWWRQKIYFSPKVDFKEVRRNPHNRKTMAGGSLSLIIFSVIFLMSTGGTAILGWILLVLGIQKPIRILLDNIFKSYVRLDGICIDVRKGNTGGNNGRPYYSYRIVDFHNKREIRVKMYAKNEQLYTIGDRVTVIHGAMSKSILDHYKMVN